MLSVTPCSAGQTIREVLFCMRSIKTRLILTFTAIILILSTVIGVVATTLARATLVQNAHSELIRTAEEEAKYVVTRVQVQLSYMEALARNSLLTDGDSDFAAQVKFCEEEAQRMGYLARPPHLLFSHLRK